ncbi:uncharacterized protein AB675_6639 [Cyphellophora attinorum]|uniref:Uncharacterized protein n=1 Tax=Cyphellophora attinorum TaxID=1664694 RepID=A0A0N0NQK4_9EURO|nr:uncharacterized protein AB675_6639 [Phialophora attinorum]KPI44011.1 hypothetical protein AB675_6639 [Phialophora attinorum]
MPFAGPPASTSQAKRTLTSDYATTAYARNNTEELADETTSGVVATVYHGAVIFLSTKLLVRDVDSITKVTGDITDEPPHKPHALTPTPFSKAPVAPRPFLGEYPTAGNVVLARPQPHCGASFLLRPTSDTPLEEFLDVATCPNITGTYALPVGDNY